MDPVIQYARTTDGVSVAYFAIGSGPPLVYVPPGGNAGQAWQLPEIRTWTERLATHHRVVRLDYRGIGLSDRGWNFDPELTARDVDAVASKEGLQPFTLLGVLHTAATVLFYAHRHPHSVSRLILWCPYASSQDFVESSPAARAVLAAGEQDWQTLGDLIGLQSAGWADVEQARRFGSYVRGGADAEHYLNEDFDVRSLLPGIRVRTLVLHRRDVAFPTMEVARGVALGLPDARFLVLEGSAMMPFFGDIEPVLSAITEFASSADAARPDGLTLREIEILILLAQGSSNEGIARALTISTRTVERHIGNIYNKIGAHNRAEATAYAFRHQFVPSP